MLIQIIPFTGSDQSVNVLTTGCFVLRSRSNAQYLPGGIVLP
jgi:hypothetical protein